MQYPIKLKMSDGTEKTFWLSDEKLQFGGTDDGVSDVQINGASIVQDGVAEIPVATTDMAGVVKINPGTGISIDPSNNIIFVNKASVDQITNRTVTNRPITPDRLNPAVKATLTDSNKLELTDSEKETACDTLGATSSKELLDAGIKSISWSVSRSEISVTTVEDPYKAQRPSGTNTRYWAKFDSCPYFYHDKLYRVTLDGVEQVPCACRYGYLKDEKKGSTHGSDTSVGGAWQSIGNMYLYDSRYPDTGEDYCVLYIEHGGMHDGGAYYYGYEVGKGILMTRSAKTVRLKIETATLTRTKLPNVLLDNFGRGDPMYVDFPNSTYYRVSLGQGNIVTGRGSAAIGFGNMVTEQGAVAVNCDNKATGWSSFAEGSETVASGQCSHSEGRWSGLGSDPMYTTASGDGSHAEGMGTLSSGSGSHSEGVSVRSGDNNVRLESTGMGSHAEGVGTKSSSSGSHSEGLMTKATSSASHAEGSSTTASGNASHAEGISTTASGGGSHAEGYLTTASGHQSHAEGYLTVAAVNSSHSEGQCTYAAERGAHAEGLGTRAVKMAQNVIGVNNIEDTETGMTAAISDIDSNGTPTSSATNRTLGKYAHIVGNGISNTQRSNAHTLDWDGNAWYAGNGEFAGGKVRIGDSVIDSAMVASFLNGTPITKVAEVILPEASSLVTITKDVNGNPLSVANTIQIFCDASTSDDGIATTSINGGTYGTAGNSIAHYSTAFVIAHKYPYSNSTTYLLNFFVRQHGSYASSLFCGDSYCSGALHDKITSISFQSKENGTIPAGTKISIYGYFV